MRRPQPEEQFYDYKRLAKDQRPDGVVYDIDEDNEMITVLYSEVNVEYREDQCVRINGILHHNSVLAAHPEMIFEGGIELNYFFDEVEWSSREGGYGRWEHSSLT